MYAGQLRTIIATGIIFGFASLAGTPQDPLLWAWIRDVMGLPWTQNQLAVELLVVVLALDLLAIVALLLSELSQWRKKKLQRESLKTRTFNWLLASLWSLKGSRVRGQRRRSSALLRKGSRPLCGPQTTCSEMHEAVSTVPDPYKCIKSSGDRLDTASTVAGSSVRSSPAASTTSSPISVPSMSPAFARCMSPLDA